MRSYTFVNINIVSYLVYYTSYIVNPVKKTLIRINSCFVQRYWFIFYIYIYIILRTSCMIFVNFNFLLSIFMIVKNPILIFSKNFYFIRHFNDRKLPYVHLCIYVYCIHANNLHSNQWFCNNRYIVSYNQHYLDHPCSLQFSFTLLGAVLQIGFYANITTSNF